MAGLILELEPASEGGTPLLLTDTSAGYSLLEFDAPEPEQEVLWASSIDTDGELPAGSRFRNRTVTVKLRIAKSTDALLEAELNKVGQAVGKIGREGGTLKFTTPAGTVGYFDLHTSAHAFPWDHRITRVKLGEVTLTFIARPEIRGTEVDLGDNVETTLPWLVWTDVSVKGDLPGRGRVVIDNDDASNDQRWLVWGIQSRYYDAAASAALAYEAESLTAMGGSATAVGPSGASGAGSNVMRNTAVLTSYQAVLSTQASGGGAHLSHVGTFRVFARVQRVSSGAPVTVALEWGTGDFRRYTRNPGAVVDASLANKWVLVDLGLVTIPKVVQGTQRWEGRVLAKSTVSGDDIDVDYLLIVPTDEGYGEASAVFRLPTPTTFSARDEFDQTAGVLVGKTAPVGGTWSGAGDTDDLSVVTPNAIARRTAVSDTGPRFERLGTGTLAATAVQVDFTLSNVAVPEPRCGVFARYTDTNNYIRCRAGSDGGSYFVTEVDMVVAGVGTSLASFLPNSTLLPIASNVRNTIRLVVDAAGNWWVWLWTAAGVGSSVTPLGFGHAAALATGGALASGGVGIFDWHSGASAQTRDYDNFSAWVPPADAAIFASQSLELRHNRIDREDSGGTLWQDLSKYEGDFLLVPPAGREGRTVRMIVKASRNVPGEGPDTGIDDISARLFYTPMYLKVPGV